MDKRTFLRKALSPWVWTNLLVMLAIVVGLVVGVWDMMAAYTRHGEKREVPKIKGMTLADARRTLDPVGLRIEVVDSIFSRTLPDGLILEQVPAAGFEVKPGRSVEVKINTHAAPTLPVPDIINNCSRREAEQRLSALGFRLADPQYVAGQKDYVLGLRSEGRLVKAGDRVRTSAPVTLVLGTGTRTGQLDTLTAETTEEEDLKADAEVVEEIQ